MTINFCSVLVYLYSLFLNSSQLDIALQHVGSEIYMFTPKVWHNYTKIFVQRYLKKKESFNMYNKMLLISMTNFIKSFLTLKSVIRPEPSRKKTIYETVYDRKKSIK